MILALLLSLSGTIITIEPPSDPAAWAEVVMTNRNVNGPLDEITTEMWFNGKAVGIEFEWDHQGPADAIIVTPPDGMFCIPETCVLILDEDTTGSLFIFEWLGF